ncbi:MAG: BrnA antitoxin family protein [Pseudomonadota bacterium]|nr:BrnA antitoxin family protein [Pseudomonadota bacterium]
MKLHNTPTGWVDPDDAPELTAEFFERATPMIGDRAVTVEEFRQAAKDKLMATSPHDATKVAFVFRIDADILPAFLATGDDWEAQMNHALRQWLHAHPAS